jgi:hypothetical protein
MSTRYCILFALTFLISGCTTTIEESDYSLQWANNSARLVIIDDDGKPVSAFGGKYVGVPGYLFVNNELAFHPGKKQISHICPRPPGAIVVLDVAPSVSFDFRAGHRYELSCKSGWPSIREIK